MHAPSAPLTLVLGGHDASGPPAIDWALAHPDRIAGLVLLDAAERLLDRAFARHGSRS